MPTIYSIKRALYKPDPTNTVNRYLQVPAGHETIRYAVDIDFTQLDEMARKAASNKSQQSHDGPVTVRVVSRTKEVS
jgi:hypothetical protein